VISIKRNILNFAKEWVDKSGILQKIRGARLKKHILNNQFPYKAFLETTNACNLNCAMCPTQRPQVKKYKRDGFMDKELFHRLIDEIASINPWMEVRLHKDGEPLLHPEIIEFIEYASSLLNNVNLVTNSTLLNEDMSHAILSTPLQNIRFSVDGATKLTFGKIRGQLGENPYRDERVSVEYDSVKNNILLFCSLRKLLRKRSPRTVVRVTDFGMNRKELDSFISYWKQYVDFVQVDPMLSWSGGQISAKADTQLKRYPCINPWIQLVVNWDGTMAPCCVYVDTSGDKKGSMFNLEKSNIRTAWKSPSIEKLRSALLKNDLDVIAPYCVHCDDWQHFSPPEMWSEKLISRLMDTF